MVASFPRNHNQEIVMASANKFYWQGGFDMLLFFPRNNNQEIVSANRNKFCWQGGFDMIRSGRDKIETPEQVGLLVSVTLLFRLFI